MTCTAAVSRDRTRALVFISVVGTHPSTCVVLGLGHGAIKSEGHKGVAIQTVVRQRTRGLSQQTIPSKHKQFQYMTKTTQLQGGPCLV